MKDKFALMTRYKEIILLYRKSCGTNIISPHYAMETFKIKRLKHILEAIFWTILCFKQNYIRWYFFGPHSRLRPRFYNYLNIFVQLDKKNKKCWVKLCQFFQYFISERCTIEEKSSFTSGLKNVLSLCELIGRKFAASA